MARYLTDISVEWFENLRYSDVKDLRGTDPYLFTKYCPLPVQRTVFLDPSRSLVAFSSTPALTGSIIANKVFINNVYKTNT